jgi:hypothetical protein
MKLAPIYSKASKSQKADMINKVLKMLFLEDPPVRCLHSKRPLSGTHYWEVADKKTSREKVSQDLRDAVRRMKHQQRDAVKKIKQNISNESMSQCEAIENS